jgi:uncharacterized cupin superfamily protein
MRRILTYLTTLGMMAAMVIAGGGLAAAFHDAHATACVNATTFNFHLSVEDQGGESELTSMALYLNADAADTSTADGDDFGDVSDEQTEVIEVLVDFASPSNATAAVIQQGVGPDRWDPSVGVDVLTVPEGWEILVFADHGTEPFVGGTDTVAQVFAEATTTEGADRIDVGSVPVDHCPGSLSADLDSSVGTAGYLTDATSGDAFAWLNTRSTFQPTVTNHGPDDEGDARLSWALDLQGSTTNVDDGTHAVIGTHFDWEPVLPCQPVHTGTIGFRPTVTCGFQPVLADDTATGTIHVDWLITGDYFIDTRVTSSDNLTADTVPANNVDHLDFAVLDPAGDEDGDGIDNGIDGSLSGATFDWDVFTPSSNFSDEGRGGTTFGTVVSGNATVSDAAGAGVTVTTDAGGAEIAACGQTTQFVGATTATITCGSITVAVTSGQVEVSLTDGSTLTLDDGDEATVDADEVTVLSGEAIITREDGSTETVGEGETWSPEDTASDSDGDGVLDGDDLCADTILPEPQPERGLKQRHYVANADGVFVDSDGHALEYTVLDTGGCSGHQIIEALELGRGHEKFGITQSAIEDWIATLES